jgi:NAD(P)-dependent dehydrogenase (short-subunit alcohol dehydrogenase family)
MTQKIALITGASRGLGAAMAEQLALRGWHVVAVARTVGGLEDLDDRVKAAGLPGAGALTLAPMDVTHEDAMRHLCRSVHDRWGGLHFWAHTAIHATALAPAPSIDMKDLDKSVAANLRAMAFLVTMTDPLLRAANGTAMFFDDPVASQKFGAAYGASKAGQIAIARNWQAESQRIGPRVLVETPRPMPTAVRARFYPGEDRGALVAPRDEAARLLDLI